MDTRIVEAVRFDSMRNREEKHLQVGRGEKKNGGSQGGGGKKKKKRRKKKKEKKKKTVNSSFRQAETKSPKEGGVAMVIEGRTPKNG